MTAATPFCPMCSAAPLMVVGSGRQAFCPNEACPVLTWNPQETAAEFRRTARPVKINMEKER